MAELKTISIRGAREHNLKNVDLDLPRDQLIVMTGLSGSGKSSLAFDTIYAEGQRRYVESLSAYARQFLEMMQKPDVDQIDGLSPAISIEQKTTSQNPRSTVGTVTEIYDYMRLLFARVGIPYSPATGLPIESQTCQPDGRPRARAAEGTRLYLLAPIVRGRKGEYRKELAELQKKGFQRVRVDGEFYEIADVPALDKKYKHDIDVVVDRVVVRPDMAARLADSHRDGARPRRGPGGRRVRGREGRERQAATADLLGEVRLPGLRLHDPRDRAAAVFFQQPVRRLPALRRPRLAAGGRPEARRAGRGDDAEGRRDRALGEVDLALLRPDPRRARPRTTGSSMTDRWQDLPEEARQAILYGTGKEKIDVRLRRRAALLQDDQDLRGRHHQSRAALEGDRFGLGARGDRALHVGHPLPRLQRLPAEAGGAGREDRRLPHRRGHRAVDPRTRASGSTALPERLSAKQNEIAGRILKEIRERLQLPRRRRARLSDAVARSSGTLSGGESQRIRLASQIGSGLTGVLYVLDEPSIGLHQRDNARLLDTLKHLRDLGNTVIVVEHDEDAILTADYVVDIGPGGRRPRRPGDRARARPTKSWRTRSR